VAIADLPEEKALSSQYPGTIVQRSQLYHHGFRMAFYYSCTPRRAHYDSRLYYGTGRAQGRVIQASIVGILGSTVNIAKAAARLRLVVLVGILGCLNTYSVEQMLEK